MSQPPDQPPPRRGQTRRGELPAPPNIAVNRLEHDADDDGIRRRPPHHIDYLHAPNASSGCSLWLLGLLGLVTVVALFAANLPTLQTITNAVTMRISDSTSGTSTAPEAINPPTSDTTNIGSDTPESAVVLARLQQIARLVTVEQHYTERLEYGPTADDNTAQPLASLMGQILQGFGLDATELMRDTITVVLVTDVQAGVDLSQLRDGDLVVSTDGTSVQVTLPASALFAVAINSERSIIEQRTTKQRIRPNQPLSGDTHTTALALTLPQACDAGVMVAAAEHAKIDVQRLLSFIGFTQVDVIAPVGECRMPASME